MPLTIATAAGVCLIAKPLSIIWKAVTGAPAEPGETSAIDNLGVEIAGGIFEKLGLLDFITKLRERFFDPRTNHDIQKALRSAWRHAIPEIWRIYEEQEPADYRAFKQTLGDPLGKLRAKWMSKETVETLFPLIDGIAPEDTPIGTANLFVDEERAANFLLQEQTQTLGLWTGVPPKLHAILTAKLLPALQFHFIEEIKRNTRARDGFFFREMMELRRQGQLPALSEDEFGEKLDALESELTDVLAVSKEILDLQKQAQAKLDALLQIVERTEITVELMAKALAEFQALNLGNLPPPAPNPRFPAKKLCLGRQPELDALMPLVLSKPPQAVCLLGGPGIGKSSIARECLLHRDAEDLYDDRRYFVDCSDATTTDAVIARCLYAMGVQQAQNPRETLRAMFDAPTLLVLDNFETPFKHHAVGLEAWIEEIVGTRQVVLMVGFRGSDAPGDLRWDKKLTVPPLPEIAAEDVFCEVAGRDFRADPDLPRFLAALGRVPLAVTLAAHRARHEPDLAALMQQYERQGPEIFTRTGDDPRTASVKASIELSLHDPRLTDAARRLLTLQAQLPAGMERNALDALMPETGGAARHCLLDIGLLETDGVRDTLLAPVREHLRRMLIIEEEDKARLISYYLTLAKEWGILIGTNEGNNAVQRITPEVTNIEMTIRECLIERKINEVMASAVILIEIFRFTGIGSPDIIYEITETAKTLGDVRNLVVCFSRLGDLAFERHENKEAENLYRQSVELSEQIGSVLGKAISTERLADIAMNRLDYPEAQKLCEQALLMYEEVEDLQGQANTIKSLGDIAFGCSRYEEAQNLYQRAFPLYEMNGSLQGQANCIKSWGDLAFRHAQYEKAEQFYKQGLKMYEKTGSILGQANCLKNLGQIEACRGNRESAASHFRNAFDLYAQVPAPVLMAEAKIHLANITLNQSEEFECVEEAKRLYTLLGRTSTVAKLDETMKRRTQSGISLRRRKNR